jgi:hypothetical protein
MYAIRLHLEEKFVASRLLHKLLPTTNHRITPVQTINIPTS